MPATGTLRIPGHGLFRARSIEAASAVYCRIRDASGEGAGTFMEGTFILGEARFRVSFNGKVWAGTRPWQSTDVPAYNPYSAA